VKVEDEVFYLESKPIRIGEATREQLIAMIEIMLRYEYARRDADLLAWVEKQRGRPE